jgi:hypothetical protein
VGILAEEFSKERPVEDRAGTTRREDLELICFEYVTS